MTFYFENEKNGIHHADDPKSEAERAYAVFKYALDVTQYYNDAVRYVNYSSLFRALAQSVVTPTPLEKAVGKYT